MWQGKANVAALTVLYDGACGFCQASVARLRWLDPGGRIELLDLHDPAVAQRYPQVDRDEALRAMQAVDARGRVFSGVDAWARIGLSLPVWKWLAWLLLVPGVHFLAAQIYGWVARNRYRWSTQESAGVACSFHARGGGPPAAQERQTRNQRG